MHHLPHYDEPLPQSQGPKLHPFEKRGATPEFVRLVSDNDCGGHSHVFEVRIGSEQYALKMFKFYDQARDRVGLYGIENEMITPDLLRADMDPFYNECRAYGRILEAGLNGKVAVRCYGHMTIPAEEEEGLKTKFGIDSWDRPDEEYAKSPQRRQPFRAIVKDFIQEDVKMTESVASKMLRDLKRIRKLGVYPMDIQARNYKAGFLLDFSVAMTYPHFLFDIRPQWRVKAYKNEDLFAFEDMMKKEGLMVWRPAIRNKAYCAKLRSQSDKCADASAKVLASELKTVPRPKEKTVKARQPRKRGRKAKKTKVVR